MIEQVDQKFKIYGHYEHKSENKNKYKTVYMINHGPTVVEFDDGQVYDVKLNKLRIDN